MSHLEARLARVLASADRSEVRAKTKKKIARLNASRKLPVEFTDLPPLAIALLPAAVTLHADAYTFVQLATGVDYECRKDGVRVATFVDGEGWEEEGDAS